MPIEFHMESLEWMDESFSNDLKMHLSLHPIALAAVRSDAVIFLLLIYCLMYFSLWGF